MPFEQEPEDHGKSVTGNETDDEVNKGQAAQQTTSVHEHDETVVKLREEPVRSSRRTNAMAQATIIKA
jgi:hypothetical protein